MSLEDGRRRGLLAARLLAQSLRSRGRPPATPLEQLRAAEEVLPGLKERMEREGYTEQEMADLIRQHSGDAPPSAPRAYLLRGPALGPRYWCAMLLVGGVWGYFGMPGRTGGHIVRPGWSGALYGAGVLLAASLLMDLVSRLRRRRRSTSG
jgi:hypothetical protein